MVASYASQTNLHSELPWEVQGALIVLPGLDLQPPRAEDAGRLGSLHILHRALGRHRRCDHLDKLMARRGPNLKRPQAWIKLGIRKDRKTARRDGLRAATRGTTYAAVTDQHRFCQAENRG